MPDANLKPLRVQILGREYGLRVREGAEEETRRIAHFVDDRMQKFRKAHPEQAELTTAVMTALALAEELHETRDAQEEEAQAVNNALQHLSRRLEDALDDAPDARPASPEADASE